MNKLNDEKGYCFQVGKRTALSSFRIGKLLFCRKRVCFLQICLNAVVRGLNQNLIITELTAERQRSIIRILYSVISITVDFMVQTVQTE